MEDLNPYIEKAKEYFYVPKTPASAVLWLYLRLSLTPGVLIPPIPPSLFKTITYPYINKFGSGSTNRKSFDYFDCLVVAMIESLDWDIHLWNIHLMELAYLRLNFLRLLAELLVKLFSWVTEINTAVDHDRTAIETSRDPPKIFIPLPKIESSSGCARSDLLLLAYF